MPKLTELFIERLPLSKTRVTHWDTLLPAFGVRIGVRTKTFLVIDSSGSRRKLGHYPALKLADARTKAREHMRAPSPQADFTTAEATAAYLAAIDVRPNTHRFYKLYLDKLDAKYSRSDLASLTPRQIAELIDSPHMHLALKVFFNWCKGQALLTVSPMENLKPIGKFKTRSRILTDEELKKVWIASEQLGNFGCIVRLCLLTGQRRGELSIAKQMPYTPTSLTFSANVTKNKREHSIPLTVASYKLLETLTGPCVSWSKPKKKLDQLSGIRGWCLHDLRRTTATNLARLGTDPFLIERILNHSMPKLQQIYNRHDWTEAMREPLQKHEDWLLALVKS